MPSKTLIPVFEMDYRDEASDHFEKVAEWLRNTGLINDWEILIPKPNQLLLDYDQPFNDQYPMLGVPDQFITAMTVIIEAYKIDFMDIKTEYTKSKSGNTHCIVTLPENVQLEPMTCAAWQAAAGSDPKREALHMKSIIMGSKNPNLLIEQKKKVLLLEE